jgi:dienelactone hydrolase
MRARELGVDSPLDLLTVSPDVLAGLRLPTTDLPLVRIGFPVMLATGQADETITPMRQYAVASALCAAGNDVSWQVYQGMGHDGVMHRSLDDAFAFARARIAGAGPSSDCAALQPPGPPGPRDPDALFNED